MSGNPWHERCIKITRVARLHCPKHIIGIEKIDVLVHKNDILELAIDSERDERRLLGHAVISSASLFDLQDEKKLSTAGAVRIDILDEPRERVLAFDVNIRFRRNAGQTHMFLAWPNKRL